MSNKKVILFYLAFGILLSLGGLIAMSVTASRSMLNFVLLQLAYAGLGYLAAWLFRKNAPMEMQEGKYASVWFVLVNAFLGMVGFTLIYYYFSHSELSPWYALCILPFVLPQFLSAAFRAYREIPQEINKVWYFPVHADEVDYDKIDTSTIFMLELEYSKSINDPRVTNTKLRAPVAMKFGDWFRSFIDNYNYKFEQDPIQYLNDDQTPTGWMFYVKPSFLGGTKFIDPELSIAENQILEKNIIMAKRVGIVDNGNEEAPY